MLPFALPDLEAQHCYRVSVVSRVNCKVREFNAIRDAADATSFGDRFAISAREKNLVLDVILRFQRKGTLLNLQFRLGHRSSLGPSELAVDISEQKFEGVLTRIIALSEQPVAVTCSSCFHFDRPEYRSVIPLPMPMSSGMPQLSLFNLGEVFLDGVSLAFSRSKVGLDNVRIYLIAEKAIHVDVRLAAKRMLDHGLLMEPFELCTEVAHSLVAPEVTRDGKA